MADYVMAGGLYGDVRRGAVVEVARAGGRGRAALRQFLRSRADYENRYPWLVRHPALLPVAWVLRASEVLRTRRGAVLRWLRGTGAATPEEVREYGEMMKRFGL